MARQYTYICPACGMKLTIPHHHKEDQMPTHDVCRVSPGTKFQRVWQKTPVIFKATGFSKNNLTK